MNKPYFFNPLKSIAMPNAGNMEPRGLIVVIGPNSSRDSRVLSTLVRTRGLFAAEKSQVTQCQGMNLNFHA